LTRIDLGPTLFPKENQRSCSSNLNIYIFYLGTRQGLTLFLRIPIRDGKSGSRSFNFKNSLMMFDIFYFSKFHLILFFVFLKKKFIFVYC